MKTPVLVFLDCETTRIKPGSATIWELALIERSADYGSSRELAKFVARILDGTHLIAANPAFDAGHLSRLLRANGECLTADYHMTDIGSLVRGWAAAQGMNLPWPLKVHAAATAAGVDPAAYEAHTALGDARLVRDVFDAAMRPA